MLSASPSRTPWPETTTSAAPSTSISVSITIAPPTTESRRSALRPGTRARFFWRDAASAAAISCSRRRLSS